MQYENWVKGIVQSMLSRLGRPKWGIVQSVNPAIPAAKVMLQPEGVLSGWLPIKCLANGAVHVISLPSIGDQVQIHPDGGDAEQGVISMASCGGNIQPPVSPITGKPCGSGEYGIFIGPLYFHLTGGKIYMGGGDLVLDGNFTATGNVTAGQGTGDQVDLLHHQHNYLPGSGTQTLTTAPQAGT